MEHDAELTAQQQLISTFFSHPNAVAYLHIVDYEPVNAVLPATAIAMRAGGPLRKGEFLLPLRVILPGTKKLLAEDR